MFKNSGSELEVGAERGEQICKTIIAVAILALFSNCLHFLQHIWAVSKALKREFCSELDLLKHCQSLHEILRKDFIEAVTKC